NLGAALAAFFFAAGAVFLAAAFPGFAVFFTAAFLAAVFFTTFFTVFFTVFWAAFFTVFVAAFFATFLTGFLTAFLTAFLAPFFAVFLATLFFGAALLRPAGLETLVFFFMWVPFTSPDAGPMKRRRTKTGRSASGQAFATNTCPLSPSMSSGAAAPSPGPSRRTVAAKTSALI